MKLKKKFWKLLSFLLLMVLSVSLFTGCTQEDAELALDVLTTVLEEDTPAISVDGTYTSKEDVSAYLHEYGHLPSNFITKKEAKKLLFNERPSAIEYHLTNILFFELTLLI